MFGWDICLHTTTSLQKVYKLRSRWRAGEATESTTHFNGLLRVILVINPHTFGTDPRAIEGPLVHIAVSSGSERVGTNG